MEEIGSLSGKAIGSMVLSMGRIPLPIGESYGGEDEG
jgi:hypothetical protein